MPRLSRNTPQWKANVKAFLYWSDLGELVPYLLVLILISGLMLAEPHMSAPF